MDGAGNALLTLRPQMWSIHSQWNAYRGESYSCSRSGQSMTKLRVFTLRRCSRHLLHSSKAEAEVFLRKEAACRTLSGQAPDFTIEGSFERRNCCIRRSSGEVVARIARKRVKNGGVVLSNDVFSLVIKPGFDAEMVMGFVIVLDRICHKSYGPVMCS
ncbi:hypothetical protein CRG98_034944 [Punica granatum]|nr:hypothetical protein CRG98_034944 [Punica granatum]